MKGDPRPSPSSSGFEIAIECGDVDEHGRHLHEHPVPSNLASVLLGSSECTSNTLSTTEWTEGKEVTTTRTTEHHRQHASANPASGETSRAVEVKIDGERHPMVNNGGVTVSQHADPGKPKVTHQVTSNDTGTTVHEVNVQVPRDGEGGNHHVEVTINSNASGEAGAAGMLPVQVPDAEASPLPDLDGRPYGRVELKPPIPLESPHLPSEGFRLPVVVHDILNLRDLEDLQYLEDCQHLSGVTCYNVFMCPDKNDGHSQVNLHVQKSTGTPEGVEMETTDTQCVAFTLNGVFVLENLRRKSEHAGHMDIELNLLSRGTNTTEAMNTVGKPPILHECNNQEIKGSVAGAPTETKTDEVKQRTVTQEPGSDTVTPPKVELPDVPIGRVQFYPDPVGNELKVEVLGFPFCQEDPSVPGKSCFDVHISNGDSSGAGSNAPRPFSCGDASERSDVSPVAAPAPTDTTVVIHFATHDRLTSTVETDNGQCLMFRLQGMMVEKQEERIIEREETVGGGARGPYDTKSSTHSTLKMTMIPRIPGDKMICRQNPFSFKST